MTDLDNWFNLFKRNNSDIDYDKAVNDLKYMVLETIEEFFVNLKVTTKRQIENSLTDLQFIFEETNKIITEFNKEKEFQLTLKAFTYLFNNYIDDIREEMLDTRKFNILNYISELKDDIEPNRAKKVKPMKFSFVAEHNDNNQEWDDEYETTEDEDYNPTGYNSLEDKEHKNKAETRDIVRKFNTEYKRSKETEGSDIFDSFQQFPEDKKME